MRSVTDPIVFLLEQFGAGSRTCLGKNISLLEINKVLPQIVRNFDFDFGTGNVCETNCAWFVYLKYAAGVKLRTRKTEMA